MRLGRKSYRWSELLGGERSRPATILFSSTLLMLVWKYFGSPAYYLEHLAPWADMYGDPQATAAAYHFVALFVLMGVVPALIVKFLFKQRLSEYGVQLGDREYAREREHGYTCRR